jgi:hypothetical protein
MAQKQHIFLSYSRHDTEIMRQVRATLQAEGLSVWSMEGIEPGTPLWDRAVEDALRAAECMVVILTPHVIDSKGVRDEIHYAQIHKVRIFPLLAAGDQETSIPYTISGVQFTDIRTRYEMGMGRLIETLHRVMGAEEIVPPRSVPQAPPGEPVSTYNPSSVSAPQPWNSASQRPAWQRNALLVLKIAGVLVVLFLLGLTLTFLANWAAYSNKQCHDGDGLCNERWLYAAMTLGLAIAFSFIFQRIAGWWRMRHWRVFWLYAVVLLAGSLGILIPFTDADVNIARLLTVLALVVMFSLYHVSKLPFGWVRRLFVHDA